MAKQGKCTNFNNCTKADHSEIIQEVVGQPFVCPELGCGQPLLEINSPSKKKWLLATIPLAVVAGVSGYYLTPPPSSVITEPVSKKPVIFEPKPAPVSPEPPKPPVDTCTLAPIETETKPNWYAVIEIGSKGVKPIAIEFQSIRGELMPITSDSRKTQNVTPKEEARIPDVVNAICEDINSFHAEYGNLPIYLVGSSSMAEVSHCPKLEEAIKNAAQLPVDFLDAEREVCYLSNGIWIPPLPTQRHCQSSVIDIGSGNIKGGYIEYCNSKREHDPKEKLVTFEIPDLGTVGFSKKSAKKAEQENISFNAAATEIRKELEEQLERQVSSRPELTNNKSRIYVVGGAPWALTTLLCLDCPQYRERSLTDDIDDYTVIKPSDIEEFYNFITQEGDAVCNPDENKYIRLDLDNTGKPLLRDKSEIDKQKDEIRDVCNAFKSNKDLVSAAEILRTIASKMEIDKKGNRKLFFMQKNLYTWTRQYLIEKLNGNQSCNEKLNGNQSCNHAVNK